MLQSLEVISVNLWDTLVSLANLVILFWLFKKFLFAPVKKIMEKRQSEVDARYLAAEQAQSEAEESKKNWSDKLQGANEEAAEILSSATDAAKNREEKIVAEAKSRAEGILRQAETEAELTVKKAADGIKREIVEVSGVLTEKMLEREINTEDHHNLIDSFLEKIGDSDGGNQ